MNVKQLFAIVTLLSASGVVMAQAPGNVSGKADAAKAMKQSATAHEHRQDDGPTKSIHSGA